MGRDTEHTSSDKELRRKILKSIGLATTLATVTGVTLTNIPVQQTQAKFKVPIKKPPIKSPIKKPSISV